MRNKDKKVIGAAFCCIILDILAFIVTTVLLFSTDNFVLMILIAALLYVFAWDAYKATEFLVKKFKI